MGNSTQLVKYRQLAELYAEKIRSGELSPEERLPSDRKLARRHQVSLSTATAAMEELVRRHLAVRRQGCGSFVAKDALARHKRLRLGFFSPDGGSHVQRMGSALLKWGEKNHCDIFFSVCPLEEIPEQLENVRLDGFMLYNCCRQALTTVRQQYRKQIPALLVSSRIDSEPEISFGYSNEKIINTAIDYLFQLGHRDIGLIAANPDRIPVTDRLEAFQTAMWLRQLPVNPAWLLPTATPEKLQRFFSSPELPTAVIIALRSQTQPVTDAVCAAKIKLPEELSILCIDEPENEQCFPISYLQIDVSSFIDQAAEKLRGTILREIVPPLKESRFELIDRGSTEKMRDER